MPLTLDSQIEAILFYKGEPLSFSELATALGVPKAEIGEGINSLKKALEGRGLCLIVKDEEAALASSPEAAEIIERISKEEFDRDLSKAAVETLSVILYRGPLSKFEIDNLRGVNSAFILRNLLVRGLIEKAADPDGKRTLLYRPAIELLAHLGLSEQRELPEYESTRERMKEFEDTKI